MKALVVGGTGFVGMNLVQALLQAGHDVCATRRARSNTLFARRLGAHFVHADLEDEASLVEAMRGREVVFMCAGHYPRYSLDLDHEVALARKLAATSVRAAQIAGVQRFIVTSSVATIGPATPGRDLSNEDDPIDPRTRECVYHATKQAIEDEVLGARHGGMDVIALCPTGIVGPLDVKAGTGFMFVALGNGLMPVYIDGRINIVDAWDVALAHVACAERGRAGQRYIVAGHNTTVRELLELAADELGVSFYSWRLPIRLAGLLSTLDEMRCSVVKGGARPFLAREFVDIVRFGLWVDNAKAMRELALDSPTPLISTIRRACQWYERYRYIRRPERSDEAQRTHKEDPHASPRGRRKSQES